MLPYSKTVIKKQYNKMCNVTYMYMMSSIKGINGEILTNKKTGSYFTYSEQSRVYETLHSTPELNMAIRN